MTRPWHAHREEVFAVMRQIDEAVQHAWSRSRFLAPRYGEVGIGCEDFDYTLKATIGEQYLRTLRNGGDPDAAFAESIEAGKESIAKWNTTGCSPRMSIGGRFQLQRNECAAESIALGFHCRFASLNQKSVAVIQPVHRKMSTVRFRSAIMDGSSYCGPACLSALSGLGTKQIAAVLRRQFNMKAVRGLSLESMKWFIEGVGYCVTATNRRASTLEGICRAGDRDVLLIELHDHWLLTNGTQVVCTQFNGRITDASESVYWQEVIEAAHVIDGVLSNSAIDSMLSTLKPSRKPTPCERLLF